FLLFGWLFSKFKTKTYLDIFYFSFLWVFLEYFRTLVFALVTLAPDSFFGAHSTFGFLGYVLASNANLLQLAQFGGVYLLSFIVIFVNLFIYWTFSKGKKGQLKLKLLILIVFIIFINLPPNIFIKEDNSKEREIKVSVLQTKNEAFSSITQQKEERKRKIYENLLLEIGKKVPDSEIIIFPEDTRFTQKLINNWRLENYYKYIFGDDEKMIIDSSRMRDKNNQTKLRLYYYNIEKDQMDEYDKLLLTPGGEYVPSIFMFLSRLAGFGGWAKELNEGKYTRGKSLEIGYFKNKGIGGVFCFEITSPEISRKMTQEGAQLFVNPVSHSSFKGYPILYHQTLNMIKVRAVENNRYFIQAGNYIPSSIITNKGRVISNKKTGPSVFNERVFFKDGQTLYVRFGNWLVGLAAVVIIIFIGRFFYIKFKWFV
ncbi:MAG: apolipoprotein N-acyltransferase, partial [Candidatus Moranbacteria bacterium]|nr:apolipoprotein N-acyltransferase [Candidatus Moranbacteria bacterium]